MYDGDHAAPQPNRFVRQVAQIALFVAIFVGAQFVFRTYVAFAYEIPTGSMENTLMPGDRVFTERVSYYFRDVAPGDIVTFEDPEVPGRILIKRCIAVGGQTVDMRNGVVSVDGAAIDEPYTLGQPTDPLSRTAVEISYPYTVPERHLWVMGDNRTNSQDSRYFGAVDVNRVHERALAVFWPIDHVEVLD